MHFGNHEKRTVAQEEFSITLWRDDEPEDHSFLAVATDQMYRLSRILGLMTKQPEQALPLLVGAIRRSLSNKDGVPEQWEAVPEDREVDGELVSRFKAPDGRWLPIEEAAQFEKLDAGSSRRRWTALLDLDEDIAVRDIDLVEAAKWIISLAANRPTRPSSSSGG